MVKNSTLTRLYGLKATLEKQLVQINEHLESMDLKGTLSPAEEGIKQRRLAIIKADSKKLDTVLDMIQRAEAQQGDCGHGNQ